MHLRVLAVVGCTAAVAAHAASAGPRIAFCRGAQLTGRFAVIRGSAGAGNIVYRLTLRNQSSSTCAVTGLPAVRLLGRGGKPLPTSTMPSAPGTATAVLVFLAPRQTAAATARFSPDVPGVGEGNRGVCEPTAYRLRVSVRGGGSTVVPILPATPVCEHGRLQVSNFGRLST